MMSYYLQYEPELKKRYPSLADKKHRITINIVFFTAVAIIGCLFRDQIAGLLIPGDPDVTVPAFSQMVQSIGAGESVADSFMDFCRQILSGGV